MDVQKTSAIDEMETQTGKEEQTQDSVQAVSEACELISTPPDGTRTAPSGSGNSLWPFYTSQKAACGFLFSRDADHRRKQSDLQACDPVKWRKVPKAQ